MRAFCNSLKELQSSNLLKKNLNKNFSFKSVFPLITQYSQVKTAPTAVYGQLFYKNQMKNFFSDKKDKKEEKDEEKNEHKENKENSGDKKKHEDSEELEELKHKYKELKTLYNEHNHKMEALKKKFEDLRGAYLSNVEETEQIKLRNDRELANTKEYAISKFAKDLLDVHDNFNRAMSAVGDKEFKSLSEEEKVETFNNFLEGKIRLVFNLNFM